MYKKSSKWLRMIGKPVVKQYRNKFYDRTNKYSIEFYNEDANKILYNGFEIHRYTAEQWHIVKDGVCVGMNAGLSGAKLRIDKLINESIDVI